MTLGPDLPSIPESPLMRVLGFYGDQIAIYDRERANVRYVKDTDLRPSSLVAIAGLPWLITNFPAGGSRGFDHLQAAHWLNRLASKRGYFDEAQIRGRGASRVAGELVFHAGDCMLTGSGVRALTDADEGIFPQGPKLPLPASEPATAHEGALILELAAGFRWDDRTSGMLLAGWCALAPLCGVLGWRPHLWITGGAGSGKTTILNEFVLPLQNECALFIQGNTTEAGIRQKLRQDALPIVMDEGEQSDDKERSRMQDVVTLLRQSSSDTGASTLRGTAGGKAMDFRIRSMACIASIQIGLHQQADLDRFCLLELRQGVGGTEGEQAWRKQLTGLARLRGDLAGRLRRRMFDGFDRLEKSLPAFRAACLQEFGSGRYADQYGVLIAGAWVLAHDGVATDQMARRFMGDLDWTRRLPERENDDAQQAWSAMLQAPIWMSNKDYSVFELIRKVVESKVSNMGGADADEADRQLRNFGLIVRLEPQPVLFIGRKTRVVDLLKETPYASDPARLFERLPGAKRAAGTQTFAGTPKRATEVPLSIIHGLPNLGEPAKQKNRIHENG